MVSTQQLLHSTDVHLDVSTDAERISNIQSTLAMLPNTEKSVLKEICDYLNFVRYYFLSQMTFEQVATFSDTNKMTSSNLAIVFAPNLLRPLKEDPIVLISMPILIVSNPQVMLVMLQAR